MQLMLSSSYELSKELAPVYRSSNSFSLFLIDTYEVKRAIEFEVITQENSKQGINVFPTSITSVSHDDHFKSESD